MQAYTIKGMGTFDPNHDPSHPDEQVLHEAILRCLLAGEEYGNGGFNVICEHVHGTRSQRPLTIYNGNLALDDWELNFRKTHPKEICFSVWSRFLGFGVTEPKVEGTLRSQPVGRWGRCNQQARQNLFLKIRLPL
jgi:hypothetical protein